MAHVLYLALARGDDVVFRLQLRRQLYLVRSVRALGVGLLALDLHGELIALALERAVRLSCRCFGCLHGELSLRICLGGLCFQLLREAGRLLLRPLDGELPLGIEPFGLRDQLLPQRRKLLLGLLASGGLFGAQLLERGFLARLRRLFERFGLALHLAPEFLVAPLLHDVGIAALVNSEHFAAFGAFDLIHVGPFRGFL